MCLELEFQPEDVDKVLDGASQEAVAQLWTAIRGLSADLFRKCRPDQTRNIGQVLALYRHMRAAEEAGEELFAEGSVGAGGGAGGGAGAGGPDPPTAASSPTPTEGATLTDLFDSYAVHLQRYFRLRAAISSTPALDVDPTEFSHARWYQRDGGDAAAVGNFALTSLPA